MPQLRQVGYCARLDGRQVLCSSCFLSEHRNDLFHRHLSFWVALNQVVSLGSKIELVVAPGGSNNAVGNIYRKQ